MRNRKIRDISACEEYNIDSFSCMKNKSIMFCNVVSDFVNKRNESPFTDTLLFYLLQVINLKSMILKK